MFRVWSPQPSIAVSPLADFTPSPNTRMGLVRRREHIIDEGPQPCSMGRGLRGQYPGRKCYEYISMEHFFHNNLCNCSKITTPELSAPNHKSQSASDLESQNPNRKNFPQIAVSGGLKCTFKSRDL